MRKASGVPTFLVLVLSAFGLISAAAAAQVTVGQLAPGTSPRLECEFNRPLDEAQILTSSGTSYVVPFPGGAITSWSTNAGAGAGQTLGFKVFRPLGPGVFQVVAHDGPRALTPSAVNTFPVSLPVRAGDILGLAVPPGNATGVPTACEFGTGNIFDITNFHTGFAADGATFSQEEEVGTFRLNVSATMVLPPAIVSISPASGSIKGGTQVVIAGANFAAVQGVSVGVTPATFTVNSEGQITAIAPKSKTLAKAPISVTTAAGTATSIEPFAYKGCIVPRLGGKTLRGALKALRRGDCRLGRVSKSAHADRVGKQRPKPGTILAPGSKVSVKLR